MVLDFLSGIVGQGSFVEAGDLPYACTHPAWYLNASYGGGCPYGWAGPGDVTWANWALARSHGLLATEPDPGSVYVAVCILYGYIPYFIVVYVLFLLFVRRGTRELNFLLFTFTLWLFNNVLIKRLAQQPRPQESCIRTCGMPSTHSAMAVGFFVLRFFESLIRMRPGGEPQGVESFSPVPFENWNLVQRLGQVVATWYLDVWDEITGREQILALVGWIVVLFPVPLSRTQLQDHTPAQVLVGSLVGFCVAAGWIYLSYGLQHRFNHNVGKVLVRCGPLPLLRYNMALPCHLAECRCSSAPGSSAGNLRWESAAPQQEIHWYLEQTVVRRNHLEQRSVLTSREKSYYDRREQRLRRLLQFAMHGVVPSVPESAEASTGHVVLTPHMPRGVSSLRSPLAPDCLATSSAFFDAGTDGVVRVLESTATSISSALTDVHRSTELTPHIPHLPEGASSFARDEGLHREEQG